MLLHTVEKSSPVVGVMVPAGRQTSQAGRGSAEVPPLDHSLRAHASQEGPPVPGGQESESAGVRAGVWVVGVTHCRSRRCRWPAHGKDGGHMQFRDPPHGVHTPLRISPITRQRMPIDKTNDSLLVPP